MDERAVIEANKLLAVANDEIIDSAYLPHHLQQVLFQNVLPSYKKAVAACNAATAAAASADEKEEERPELAALKSARDAALAVVRGHMQALHCSAMEIARAVDNVPS